MRSANLAVVLLLCAATVRSEEIACQSSVLSGFWRLLAQARFGEAQQERAAFVTRDEDGNYHLVFWPFLRELRRASYFGKFPRNVVAIVHTHPNGEALPSEGDRELARRIGLPIYVLTRTCVSRTTGKDIDTLWLGDWNPTTPRRTAPSVCSGEGNVPKVATR